KNIQFRSAHFKLELYGCLGSGQFGDHVGVIDTDCVMTKPIDFPLLSPGLIMNYDITDHIVSEYGRDRMRLALERVSGTRLSKYSWFGGEFLYGHAESFRILTDAVMQLWPRYLQHIGGLLHVGDEMVLAASVPKTNLRQLDAGSMGF